MAVGAVLSTGGTLALRRKFSARRFWDDRLDALAEFLELPDKDTDNDREPRK